MSAAPLTISKDATVVAVGSDGKLRTLRQGQGAFTCVPDDPNTPGIDPMCLDRIAFEWFKALLAHEKAPEGKVWLAYMLKGGSDASNDDPFASEPQAGKKWVATGPHVMIGGPGITKMLDTIPQMLTTRAGHTSCSVAPLTSTSCFPCSRQTLSLSKLLGTGG
jgi:hypothetical protein